MSSPRFEGVEKPSLNLPQGALSTNQPKLSSVATFQNFRIKVCTRSGIISMCGITSASLERGGGSDWQARTLTETRASWRAGRPSGALDSNTHWPIHGKKAPNMRKREPDGTQISFTIIPLAQTSLVLSVLFSLEAGRRVAYSGKERDWTLWSLLQNVFPVTLPPSNFSVLIKHTHAALMVVWFLYYYILILVYYIILLHKASKKWQSTALKSADDTVC